MTAKNRLLRNAFITLFEGKLDVIDTKYRSGKYVKINKDEVESAYTLESGKKFNFPYWGWLTVMNYELVFYGNIRDIRFGGPCQEGPYFHVDMKTNELVVQN
jgi:hypothetical protein